MDNFFKDKALNNSGIYNLSAKEAYQMCLDGAVIIDVREEYLNRFKILDVPCLMFFPKASLLSLLGQLPKDKPLIISDASGIYSAEAVKLLNENGFAGRCANLSGGLVDWEREGLPIKIDITERLSGQCACQLRPREKGNR